MAVNKLAGAGAVVSVMPAALEDMEVVLGVVIAVGGVALVALEVVLPRRNGVGRSPSGSICASAMRARLRAAATSRSIVDSAQLHERCRSFVPVHFSSQKQHV